MPKEYKTIREVAGPLMMVSDVDNVKYDDCLLYTSPSPRDTR